MQSQLSLLKRRINSQKDSGGPEKVEESKISSSTDSTYDSYIGGICTPSITPITQSQAGVVTQSKWICRECVNECIPITKESRCLCGHRMKEHPKKDGIFRCSATKCLCTNFFYIVGEGSWILRCSCKHKHTDHDCRGGPFKCTRCASCEGFSSPWVCNCGHSWSAHDQRFIASDVSEVVHPSKKSFSLRQDGLS